MPDLNIGQQMPLNQEQISKLALLLAGNKDVLADNPDPNSMAARSDAQPTGAATLAYKPQPIAPAPDAVPVAPMSMGERSDANIPTVVAAAPAVPAMAASIGVQPKLPTAPTYTPPDMAARAALVAKQNKDAQPTDPNSPEGKTHWYDRLLGGLVGFGRGYVHDPNAVAEGGAVTNRRYNSAEALRSKRLDADNQAVGEFDRNSAQGREAFNASSEDFGNQLKAAQEARAQTSSAALDAERTAKANRQDYLSMSPRERADQVSDLEKTSGMKFNDTQKQDFILTGKIPNAAAKPSLAETFKQREQDGISAGLKGDQLLYYKINGKLREPNPDAEAKLEDARLRHQDSEADRAQRQDDSNFNKSQARLETYNKQKADIAQREHDAYAKLEQESRDKKTGTIIDPATLNNRKGEIQKSFKAEYDALGGPPAETPARNTRPAPAAGKAAPAPAAAAPPPPAAEERVPVIAPDGKTRGSVPKSQLATALGKGYKQVKP